MKRSYLFLIAILLLSVTNLFSQNFAKEGVWEIGGNISFTNTTDVNNGETAENSLSVFSLEVPIHYFVIDGLGLGVIPSFESISFGDNSVTGFGIYLAPSWNFETSGIVFPFIEGRVGYNSISNGTTISGIAWAAVGGIKVQVGSNSLVNIGLGYMQRTLESDSSEGGRDGDNIFGINAGFAIFIGK